MHNDHNHWSRRKFTGTLALAGITSPLWASSASLFTPKQNPYKIYCFTKPLDKLETPQLMQVLKQAGLDGPDLTVRSGGHVLPENVEKELPGVVKEAEAHGLEIKLMATRINNADDPATEVILKTAADVGIKDYRMGYIKYDFDKGIVESLDAFKPQLAKLEALNKKYGLHAGYQNHVGTRVGGQIWDLWYLFNKVKPEYIGCQYDIRHAVAEGGEAWPVPLRLITLYIKSIVIKDFLWKKQKNGQYKPKTVPLGEGMVDFVAFFKIVKELNLQVPFSIHFEYDLLSEEEEQLPEAEKMEKYVAVIKRDVDKLKGMIAEYLS